MRKKVISVLLFMSMMLGMSACGQSNRNTNEDNTVAGSGNITESTGGGSESNEPTETDYTSATDTSATDTSESEQATTTHENALDPSKTYKILFVGNSYTYYNDMPTAYFGNIAKSAGYNVTVSSVTKGSYTLEKFADATDEYGKTVDKLLTEVQYDYVIIQEQSSRPAEEPAKFYDGVRAMLEKIKANGATPVLYSTWGRKEGHSILTQNGWTNESMTWKLAAAYEAIGSELDIEVAYVGLAFFDVHSNNKSINLYNTDLTHPSPAGSYLAALTLFSTIFKYDPVAISYAGTFTDEAVAILRQAARHAVYETPQIPEQYKTSSVGVKTEPSSSVVDYSQMINLSAFPTTPIISVLSGEYDGKTFSGILGTKGAIASLEYSVSGLSEAQKADIADIGYGVSVIGIEKMDSSAKGYQTAVQNLVNGHWGSSYMANFEFDTNKYDINGNASTNGKYTGLITLNFGSQYKFDAVGFFSGSLAGFPGAAEVYVSSDGSNWTLVPTACWDKINGTEIVSCGASPKDPWADNSSKVSCLFDMGDVEGQYVRIGVVIGRNDTVGAYNTINTREVVVYGTPVEAK